MATTPKYALRYPAATDPADVPVDMGELAIDVENVLFGIAGASRYRGALTPAAFAALTGVVDGDIADLIVDATAGVIWRVRYRAASASAFKWEFMGGPALYAVVPTNEALGATGTYSNLATVGPQVTVPRGGDYDISLGARFIGPASGTFRGFMAPKLGATLANDANAAIFGTTANLDATPEKTSRVAGLAANDVILAQYRSDVAGTNFMNRWLSVLPVRIS